MITIAESWKREGKLEVVKQMLADNIPLDTISKYSGFPQSEIQKLIRCKIKSPKKFHAAGGA